MDDPKSQLPSRAMNPHQSRSLLIALALLPILAARSGLAQETLPEPARMFTPKTALAVYFDLERSAQSGIWKTLETRLGPLREQLGALPHVPPELSAPLAGMPDLQTGEVAEFAIAIEGQNAFKNMENEQYDPDFSVVAAVRFKETIDQEKLVSQLLEEADKQQTRPPLEARGIPKARRCDRLV